MLNYDPYVIAKAHLELWNNRNPVPYKELLAPAATFRLTFEKEEKPAVKMIEEYANIVHAAFPEIRFDHIDIIPTEGTLTLEWVATGIHKGKVRDLEPTGRHVRLPGTTVLKINEDGKIVKETIYMDLLAVTAQIGFSFFPVPEPARLREIALELVERLNQRNVERLTALFTPQPILTFNAISIDEKRLSDMAIRNLMAFADLKAQARHVAVRGNEVVLEVEGVGTHTGAMAAAAPTGKPVKIEACLVLTFEGERIAKLRYYGDQFALLVQVGKVPELVVK